jgi:hypothetical protein
MRIIAILTIASLIVTNAHLLVGAACIIVIIEAIGKIRL